MYKVLICRHSNRDSQYINCGISDDGIKLIDSRINDMKKWISYPEVIYTSPYRRTLETAQCISSHFYMHNNIQFDNMLEEVLFHEEQKIILGEPLKRKLHWDTKKDLENWDSVNERTNKFLQNLKYDVANKNEKDIICVTHGGVINSILTNLDPTYSFDKDNTNPNTYVPGYCDFIVLQVTTDDITILHKNF